VAIWAVLAAILLDWERVGRQAGFLAVFALCAWAFRWIVPRLAERDRWYLAIIWLAACGFSADWSGLHFMVGAFLAGAVLDRRWFNQEQMDSLRYHLLLTVMPIFFLSTGLRTNWSVGSQAVFLVAAALLVASVGGKLIGLQMAGKILHWEPGEAAVIGWLLQTKALIMIIFVSVLLDRHIISSEMFTALLLMAAGSTMLTVPVVAPMLRRLQTLIGRNS